MKNSAFLERLLAKDLEVIFFTDPIDEYLMQNLTDFEDHKFANASKEDLKFDDKDDDEKAKQKVRCSQGNAIYCIEFQVEAPY